MLGNLIDKINKTKIQSLKIIKNLPVIELSDDDCQDFVDFIQRTLNVNSICNSHSFQVETSPDHWAVCSNQYLALAAVAYDLALCLKKYFDFFDLKIRPNERESKLIIKLQNEFKNSAIQDISKIDKWLRKNKSKAYFLHCNENPNDQDSLCYFLAGIDSKKFGNEKGVFRGTQDLFGAYILSTEPVTTAASGFLGGLVFALAQEPSFYKRISDIFKNSSQRPLLKTNDKEHSSLVSSYSFTPTQIIYYGVPGCGKSHTVDAEINKSISEYNKGRDESDKISYEKQVIRVVFHPDYGNSDFIGQIMPKLRERGGVDYVFKPGPLAQILRMAYLNSDKPYFLVVEEINRGNAAAIFGETFQLLDRIKDGKKDKNGYGPGWSSYSILNDDVNDYIRDIKAYEKFEHSGSIKANHPKDMINGDGNPVDAPDANGHKEIDFSTATSYCSLELILQGFDCPQTFRESTAIRLPPNLSIYATMNTSDQNVFTLDNAFQRRWEMKQVPNELKNTGDAAEVAQYNQVIKNGVSWGDFRKAVNEVIMDSAQANGLSSMEDKRLGGWFFTPPDNFAEKVLKYLWDDAFKFDRPNQFTGFKTLEELVTNFNKDGFKVFKDDRISKLQKDSSTTPNGSAQNDTPVVDG